MWKKIREVGKDAEDWAFYKAKMNPLNEVKRHKAVSASYDFQVKSKITKKSTTKYVEVKAGKAKLSKKQKEFQQKSSNFKLKRENHNNPLHITREAKRKFSNHFSRYL